MVFCLQSRKAFLWNLLHCYAKKILPSTKVFIFRPQNFPSPFWCRGKTHENSTEENVWFDFVWKNFPNNEENWKYVTWSLFKGSEMTEKSSRREGFWLFKPFPPNYFISKRRCCMNGKSFWKSSHCEVKNNSKTPSRLVMMKELLKNVWSLRQSAENSGNWFKWVKLD